MKSILKSVITLVMICIALSTATFAANNDLKSVEITLINQNPDPVYAGDVLEVVLGINNMGYGTIDDTILQIEDEYPFTVISDKIIELDTLVSSDDYTQTEKVKLRVDSDAKAGDYELTIKEISGESTIEHTITLDVASNNNIEVVSIDKNSISPGAVDDFTFKIKNVGSTQLKNIEFSWGDEDEVLLPVNGDSKVFIESLDVDEETDVKFKISASSAVSADLYKIDISLSYENVETSQETVDVSNAGIYVGGETEYDIIFDEMSDSEYVFTIANIGANDASSVKVSVNDESNWVTSGKSAEIIGDLNKGDYTTISFDFSRSMGDLILDVDYTDTSGNRVSSSKVVKINTESNSTVMRPSANNGGINGELANQRTGGGPMSGMQNGISTIGTWLKYLGYGLVIFVVAFVGFRVYKKKKTKKK